MTGAEEEKNESNKRDVCGLVTEPNNSAAIK
jgi:hypothetical protein